MPAWVQWLTEHWLAVMLILGALIAVWYVLANRDLLFYKQ